MLVAAIRKRRAKNALPSNNISDMRAYLARDDVSRLITFTTIHNTNEYVLFIREVNNWRREWSTRLLLKDNHEAICIECFKHAALIYFVLIEGSHITRYLVDLPMEVQLELANIFQYWLYIPGFSLNLDADVTPGVINSNPVMVDPSPILAPCSNVPMALRREGPLVVEPTVMDVIMRQAQGPPPFTIYFDGLPADFDTCGIRMFDKAYNIVESYFLRNVWPAFVDSVTKEKEEKESSKPRWRRSRVIRNKTPASKIDTEELEVGGADVSSMSRMMPMM